MRTVVVYETMFGTTAAVAKAVTEGLAMYGDVDVLDVNTAARRALRSGRPGSPVAWPMGNSRGPEPGASC